MTISVDLSSELQDWIQLAGLDIIQGSKTDDGRTVIWNKGGEICYFISVVDGYYVITSSQRMDAENFHFGTVSMAILERYLYGRFGGSVRSIYGLQRVRKPFFLPTNYKRAIVSPRLFLLVVNEMLFWMLLER
ncbi:Imm61 family immunity protein [Mycobacterium shinjukuense]|uniref:Immunity factor for TNT n=1 Tax=Mycobacterium shinjukuense TaxID=398694 RepID=A0A7I7MP48_9MYCO|nr:Imm61 family immunity protein [Mycobacterium shinjukuense]BBX73283.1 hypothetical protein MSHI_11890 [Mycobacterium shinjukuense]